MIVHCPNCQQKAIITSRNNLNEEKTVADLYCSCTNKDCFATFVTTLGFKHYLNPPRQTTMQLAVNLLSNLSKDERAALLKGAID
ncbi:MAG: ogr/Delta-like zinc finger family protein [Methylococcales bacterium]|nr:ogr/Delta-like zinc finger family protein [Methylococcales bacterium]